MNMSMVTDSDVCLFIYKDVTFLSTGEALIFNNEYVILSAPPGWGLSSSEVLSIDSSKVKSFISIMLKEKLNTKFGIR